jgi:DNA-binding CsgD family transcriptional regulator
VEIDQLESLLEWIYSSALAPILWEQTRDRIAEFTDGRDASSVTDGEPSRHPKSNVHSLQRHLQIAQTIRDRIDHLQSALRQHLERSGVGQLLLDEHGHVTFCDDNARTCLERGGLSIDGRALIAEVATQQIRLDDAMKRVLTKDATPVIVRFDRSRQSTPLFATLSRVRSEGVEDPLLSTDAVMVHLRDPEDFGHIDASRLQALFGLTARESALALAMVRGESLSTYALTNSVTRETARSHLKSLFRKVGVRGQRQLVSILLNALR